MKSTHIHELLNSGLTLTAKETELVEQYLFEQSDYYYPPNYPVPQEVLDDKRSKTLASGAVSKPRRRTK